MNKVHLNLIQNWIWKLIRGFLLAGICFIILYPLFINFSTSLMSQRDLFDHTVVWVPRSMNILNILSRYLEVAELMEYPTAFLNSFLLAGSVGLVQLVSCTIVGYGFARFEFRGRGFFFALVIFTLLVPPQMITIPLFLNFRFFDLFGLLPEGGFNLIGTYWPFILISLTGVGFRNGLFIYIARQHFRNMPNSLEEAAYIDGAGQIKTFYKIMLPGAVPVLVVIFLFSFVWQWNDIFFTSTFLRERSTLLPFTLRRLQGNYDIGSREWEFLSVIRHTGILLFLAPLLFIYIILQRYFIESVERTGIVG